MIDGWIRRVAGVSGRVPPDRRPNRGKLRLPRPPRRRRNEPTFGIGRERTHLQQRASTNPLTTTGAGTNPLSAAGFETNGAGSNPGACRSCFDPGRNEGCECRMVKLRSRPGSPAARPGIRLAFSRLVVPCLLSVPPGGGTTSPTARNRSRPDHPTVEDRRTADRSPHPRGDGRASLPRPARVRSRARSGSRRSWPMPASARVGRARS
jgi:hypothetical protein